jgi:hypothetical protein
VSASAFVHFPAYSVKPGTQLKAVQRERNLHADGAGRHHIRLRLGSRVHGRNLQRHDDLYRAVVVTPGVSSSSSAYLNELVAASRRNNTDDHLPGA